MADPTISCPNCKSEIKLTESLAAPLLEETRREFERLMAQKDAGFAEREAALRTGHAQLKIERDSIGRAIDDGVAQERHRIVELEAQRARQLVADDLAASARELSELHAVLKQRDEKLRDAQAAQAALIRQARDLDDARRELELTVETRVQEGLVAVGDAARRDAEAVSARRVREKEEQIAGMQRQIEELKRRAEQGSQQLQGEAMEVELENLLRVKFPADLIEPVGKGEFGGDILQRVVGPGGQVCGAILWETKRTRAWSHAWLGKLRADQRVAGADVALIVSQALPKNVDRFDLVDGVWVAEPRCALAVSVALRQSLISSAAERLAREGQETKMELVYEYLTGSGFRHRVAAIVEKFSEMQEDLDRERKWVTRQWAKREQQLRIVADSTAGMYGDLQGIAGRSLEEIEGLSPSRLELPTHADS